MKVTIFGTGYVGLVTGACLSEVGHDVTCVDVDEDKIAGLNEGVVPIYEPGLEQLIVGNHASGRLQFTTDPTAAIERAEVIFIAVGTPPDENGSADLQYVLEVARTVAAEMTGYKLICTKSTVPVGTSEKVAEAITVTLAGRDVPFEVASNPEFLKEGAAVADFMRPDRIIVGSENPAVQETMRELYAPFTVNHDRIVFMDIRSAELTKYAANAMLATKISFINEIANLAERLGADIENVRQGIGSDSRIGYSFIYPGCGYGGSCFPKDIKALIKTAEECSYDATLLRSVDDVNDRQKSRLFEKLNDHFKGALDGLTIAVWGLSFKPETDDMREAASLRLLEQLFDAGANIQAYDPQAMEEAQRRLGHRGELTLVGTKETALRGAAALVICTEWRSFRSPDFDLIKQELTEPVIFDGRNLYEPSRMKRRGFAYYGIGRGIGTNG